jgi:hypothetical protein
MRRTLPILAALLLSACAARGPGEAVALVVAFGEGVLRRAIYRKLDAETKETAARLAAAKRLNAAARRPARQKVDREWIRARYTHLTGIGKGDFEARSTIRRELRNAPEAPTDRSISTAIREALGSRRKQEASGR